jgi:hypothetical protein
MKVIQSWAQSPQHEVLRAFLVGAWQARLPKHPSKKPVTPKACGALGKTNLLRCVSAANTIQPCSACPALAAGKKQIA